MNKVLLPHCYTFILFHYVTCLERINFFVALLSARLFFLWKVKVIFRKNMQQWKFSAHSQIRRENGVGMKRAKIDSGDNDNTEPSHSDQLASTFFECVFPRSLLFLSCSRKWLLLILLQLFQFRNLLRITICFLSRWYLLSLETINKHRRGKRKSVYEVTGRNFYVPLYRD